jgi:hypothetical protein
MTALPLASDDPRRSRLSWQLLSAGIPPSLLLDLLDPVGMRTALAAELAAADVTLSPAPAAGRTPTVVVRTA